MQYLTDHPYVAAGFLAALLVGIAIGWIARNIVRAGQAQRKEFFEVCRNKLACLRAQTPHNSAWAKHIAKDAQDGKVSLEELGTTAEELKKLGHRLDCKERAMNALYTLRFSCLDDYDRAKGYAEAIPGLLKGAEISAADIGSSDEEIASLPKSVASRMVRQRWNVLCAFSKHEYALASDISAWLQASGLVLAEVDISQEDFDQVMRVPAPASS